MSAPRGIRLNYHHLRAGELVHHQLAHIGVVGENGTRIGEHDLLGNGPVLGHFLIEFPGQTHAVELGHHPAGVVLPDHGRQRLRGQLVQIVDDLLVDAVVGIGVGVVFLLALLHHQQQRPLPGVEPGVLQGLLDEFRLPRLEKAGEGIDRNGHGMPPLQ